MTLPKAEDILIAKMNEIQGELSGILWASTAREAMKEYARQVLDYSTEKAKEQNQYNPFGGINQCVESILKIKDEL